MNDAQSASVCGEHALAPASKSAHVDDVCAASRYDLHSFSSASCVHASLSDVVVHAPHA